MTKNVLFSLIALSLVLWRGLYVVHVEPKDTSPGALNGEKYGVGAFVWPPGFIQAKGPDTIRPAPARPNLES